MLHSVTWNNTELPCIFHARGLVHHAQQSTWNTSNVGVHSCCLSKVTTRDGTVYRLVAHFITFFFTEMDGSLWDIQDLIW